MMTDEQKGAISKRYDNAQNEGWELLIHLLRTQSTV